MLRGFDWQAAAVALIVLTAAVYVARRAFARLLSMRAGAKSGAPACGGCEQDKKSAASAPAAKVLVQIAPSKNAARRR